MSLYSTWSLVRICFKSKGEQIERKLIDDNWEVQKLIDTKTKRYKNQSKGK